MQHRTTALRLEDIETFVAVADAGSMVEGARHLSISKSVVSQRIARLESTLGERLIQRSTRSLGMTELGHALYERASRVLNGLNEMADMGSGGDARLSGPVRLTVPMSFGQLHLGPALFAFAKAHEEVRVRVDLDDRFVDLMSDGYDLALRIGRLEDSALVARRIATSRRAIVCSPDYANAHELPKRLAELAVHRCISYAHRSDAQQWRFEIDRGEKSVRLESRFEASNGYVQCDAARAGLGLAILPTFICSEAIRRGGLVEVTLSDARPTSDPIHLLFPQNRYLSKKVRMLADHLAKAFGEPPYWDEPFAG